MKRLNIIKYITVALLVLSFSSCEDFLIEENTNEISTESFWNNLSDCNQGVTAIYNQFRSMNLMGVRDEINRSDLAFPGFGRPNTSNVYYLQTFTASSSGANNKWEHLYIGIFRANQAIAGLQGIEEDMVTEDQQEDWTILMAQARFFRGLFYFYLHSSYNNGSVVLFDFVPENESEFNQPLTDEAEIKEFFRADLVYALENLPAQSTTYDSEGAPTNNPDLGRVTSGAAASVLGKSYLYEKDYTTAGALFSAVIQSGIYRLVNVADNFTTRGEFNQESILEIGYDLSQKVEENSGSGVGTTNNYNMTFSPVGGWRSCYPANWLILEYMEDPLDPTDPRNIIEFETEDENGQVVSNQRLRVFPLRTSYSVALVQDDDMPYYAGQITADGTAFNNGECAYWRKNTNWDITDSEKATTINEKSGVNYRVIRYADILLMYAECLIQGGQGGNVDEALRYVNMVRYRSALQLLGQTGVNTPNIPIMDGGSDPATSTYDGLTYTAQELMDHLMYSERPLELSAEGYAIRQIDMRRWGIAKARFEDLASRRYWADNYPFYSFIDEDDKTRWSSVLVEGENPEYDGRDLTEFAATAINYSDEDAYWPIPTSETTANSMIN